MTNVNFTKTVFDRINIYPQTKKKLVKLKEKHGTSIAQFVEDAIEFISKNNIDPKADYENSSKAFSRVEELVKKRTDTIVAFIRKQETEILIPSLNRVNELFDVLTDKEIEKGTLKPEEAKIISNQAPTEKDEQILKLQQENEQLNNYLKEVTNSIKYNKTALGQINYQLNISENMYKELKSKFA